MNWNPYKRIAELEAMHTKNIAVLGTLADKLNDLQFKHDALSKWVLALAAAPVRSEGAPVHTKAEIDAVAEQKRLQKREYNKAYNARKRARAKQNEYQRAYRARKKAAAQAVGGTE